MVAGIFALYLWIDTRYTHRQPEFDHREYHHTWLDYLYWDSELES